MAHKILYCVFSLFLFCFINSTCVYSEGEEISLDYETPHLGMSIEDTIKQRRSIRHYSHEKMTFNDVSKLLYFANGVTKKNPLFGNFRAAPSAGALYPIEIYFVSNGIPDLADGLYWFNVDNNSIVIKRKGVFADQIAKFCYGQRFISQAETIFFMNAVWERTTRRYGERGRKYVLLDAGHIAQNFYLEATALGLAPCAIGAFNDNQINNFLEIDGKKESCIYIMVIGK